MLKVLRLAVIFLAMGSLQKAFPNDPFARTTLAWLGETEPDAIIDGVHLLSGQFCMREVDHVVPGPTPLPLERFYNANSGSEDGFRYFDWHIFELVQNQEYFLRCYGLETNHHGRSNLF